MQAWWDGIDGFQKVFWAVAIVSSVFFVLQFIFTLVGGDDMDSDTDTDFDIDADHGSAFGFFTIRNMIAFFLGFSWFGLAAIERGLSRPETIGIGCAAGFVLVIVIMLMMKGLYSLKSSGTLSLKNAVGKEGTVQIAVPENMSGRGKVNVVVQGRMIDLEASTKGERLTKGMQVQVTDVIGNQALLVEKSE